MLARLIKRLTYANVVATLALFFALSTGAVYAANEWTGENIVDGSLTYLDIAPESIGSGRIQNESLVGGDIMDGTLTQADLGPNSVGSSEILPGAVGTYEIANSAVTSFDIATNAVGSSEIVAGAVGSSEIAYKSVTFADINGADFTTTLTVPSGFVQTGRCRQYWMGVTGADVGDFVHVGFTDQPQIGIFVGFAYVQANDVIIFHLCNLTGATSPAMNDMPVRVVSID